MPCMKQVAPGVMSCFLPAGHEGPCDSPRGAHAIDGAGTFAAPLVPAPPPVTLESIEKAVDDLEKQFADVPGRIEVAYDIWGELAAQAKKAVPADDLRPPREGYFVPLLPMTLRGLRIVLRPDFAAGEWAPVYNVRRRHAPGRAT